MTKPIIAVIGATGAQGGSLCDAILSDANSEFSCRAVTRDPNKDKARILLTRGSEIVQADLDDVDSLTTAFTGAHAVFAVTNFWEHFSGAKEMEQAKNIADACRAAGIKHVVWSSLEDTRDFMDADDTRMPMLQEKYRVPHFDAKAEADKYFVDLPVTILWPCFYWDNLYAFGLAPKRDNDGKYSWAFPMGDNKMAGIAAEDIGKVAYGIFKAGSEYIGKTVGIASEFLSIKEMGDKISAALDIGPIAYHDVSADAYRAFGFPGAEELGNMFQVYRDFEAEFKKTRSPELARKLNPELMSFDQFLAKYKSLIPV